MNVNYAPEFRKILGSRAYESGNSGSVTRKYQLGEVSGAGKRIILEDRLEQRYPRESPPYRV